MSVVAENTQARDLDIPRFAAIPASPFTRFFACCPGQFGVGLRLASRSAMKNPLELVMTKLSLVN